MEEFVFGTTEKETAPLPTPDAASPAPQAPQEAEIPPTPITPFALLPTAKPPQPFASTPEPVPLQSKMLIPLLQNYATVAKADKI
jgi:hypothetical protein